MFLGLNLVLLHVNYLLLVSLSWNCRGLCKRLSLKDPINVTFTISFLFLKKKESRGRILTVCRKKTEIVWD